MFNFIRMQFEMGRITAEQVRACPPRWITPEQADAIVGSAHESDGEDGDAI